MGVLRPAIASINDEPRIIPSQNDSGGAFAEGDVVAWAVSASARKAVETPSATNRYRPAGVVDEGGMADGGTGWIYTEGRPVSAKVLGEAGLVAGTPLQLVNGQTYLARIASPVEGARYAFVAAQTWETASVALKAVSVSLSVV